MDNFDALWNYVLAESQPSSLFPGAKKRKRKMLERILMSWPENGSCMSDTANVHNALALQCSGQKVGFAIPPFVWMWLAEIVLKLVIKWWNNHGVGAIVGARQELARFALHGTGESE